MQLFASFYNLKFHSHRQISLAADCRQFPGYTFARFLPCRFDPNQFLHCGRSLTPAKNRRGSSGRDLFTGSGLVRRACKAG
jgi:hypothetical protein